MLKTIKKFTPLLLMLFFAFCIWFLFFSKPVAKRNFSRPEAQIAVDTMVLHEQDYPVELNSYGLVEAQIQTKLTAQVSGKIIFVSESMRSGGFFEKGDLLIQIEDVDYRAQLNIAYANLVEAEQNFSQQQALAEQAKIDWLRLGKGKEASDLVLRKPQLASAKAKMDSAKGSYEQAKINLERTKIKAPYSGRVLSKNVDLGQVISSSSELGEIYSSEAIEVNLPIKNNEISLIDLPESYKGAQREVNAPVTLISQLAGNTSWQAQLVRTASSINAESRQLHVVARLSDPFGEKAYGKIPLKIGQYVTAKIKGKTVKNAIVLANKAIYQGTYVYLYVDGQLKRQEVSILWQNNEVALLKSGLKDGDILVTTPLGQVSSGTPVKLKNEKNKAGKPMKGERKERPAKPNEGVKA